MGNYPVEKSSTQKLINTKDNIMENNEKLTRKEKGLISVGASVAAGCQPCTAFHIRAALEAGASEVEIRQSVEVALRVREDAVAIMAGVAAKHLGAAQPEDNQLAYSKSTIDELVALSAAFAINCTTSLTYHINAAQLTEATEQQIQIALGISRSIKKTAARQVEAMVIGIGNADSSDDGCGCQETEVESGTDRVSCCE
jgi:AhpD family alkylhydroperoxidase